MSDLELENEQEQPSSGNGFVKSLFEWIETVVTALVLVAVIFTFVTRVITVEGRSMQPTYFNGDRVLVTQLAGEAKCGDVVIVVNALKEPIIKRVIATGGQTVDFDPAIGEVIVDGSPVYGAVYGIENGITTLPANSAVMEFPQTVPAGCVFVLGDNRQNSTDSRYADVGMVDRRNILGKVVLDLFPFQVPIPTA